MAGHVYAARLSTRGRPLHAAACPCWSRPPSPWPRRLAWAGVAVFVVLWLVLSAQVVS